MELPERGHHSRARVTAPKAAALVWPAVALSFLAFAATAMAADRLDPAYVFLVDNSGSMSRESSSHGAHFPATDVDRLAVFAVRAILQALDESDAAAVVNLQLDAKNPPREMPIGQLHENRNELLDLVQSDAYMAQYDGQHTECLKGLGRVIDLVRSYGGAKRKANPNASGDVHVMFLTDGGCDEGNHLGDLEKRLRGAAPGFDVHFWLLTFQGRESTKELAEIAGRLGGSHSEVASGQPSAILETFAKALSASRGVEAKVYRASDRNAHGGELVAHPGAEHVYLMAIAPDHGSEMKLQLNDGGSTKAVPLTPVASERFQFPGAAHAYRLFVGSYVGDQVKAPHFVVNGADDWTIIQLPDYRPVVEMRTCAGPCGATPCATFGTQFEDKSQICRWIRVVKRSNSARLLDGGLDGVNAGFCNGPMSPSAFDTAEWKAKCGTQIGATKSARGFEFRQDATCDGNATLMPWITFEVGGRTSVRVGSAGTYACNDTNVRVTPNSLALGILTPGGKVQGDLTVEGPVADADVRFTFTQATGKELPKCARVLVDGKTLKDMHKVSDKQTLHVSVEVPPWCGVGDAREHPIEFKLGLSLRKAGTVVNSFEVPTTLVWKNDLTLNHSRSDPLALSVAADSASAPGDLLLKGAIPAGDVSLTVGATPDPSHALTPESLHLEFLGADGVTWEPMLADKPHLLASAGQQRPLRLRAKSDKCCTKTTEPYTFNLAISDAKGTKASAVIVPVQVTVTQGRWLACNLWWILTALAILAAILAIIFVINLVTGIHRLKTAPLATALSQNVKKVVDGMPVPCPKQRVWDSPLAPGALGHLAGNPIVFFKLGFGRVAIVQSVKFDLGPTTVVLGKKCGWLEVRRDNVTTAKFVNEALVPNQFFVRADPASDKSKARIAIRTTRGSDGSVTIRSGGFATQLEQPGSSYFELVATGDDPQGATVTAWQIQA